MTNVSFLGLGAMGAPMASRILSAGFPLTLWNRSREKGKGLVEPGARWTDNPREAAQAGDVVATMLATPRVVRRTDQDASEAGFGEQDFGQLISYRLGKGASRRS
jgi:3-hydroxyisobutyrate dehydrogenase-like beta-hydroxyacid dehydrogenase